VCYWLRCRARIDRLLHHRSAPSRPLLVYSRHIHRPIRNVAGEGNSRPQVLLPIRFMRSSATAR
jgi:hypothetical protein